jgi:hypothetical protein
LPRGGFNDMSFHIPISMWTKTDSVSPLEALSSYHRFYRWSLNLAIGAIDFRAGASS